MAAIPTSTYTYNLAGLSPSHTWDASVIAADSTATTLLLNCVDDEPSPCALTSITATFGPWAQVTPPSGASTGALDLIMTLPVRMIPNTSTLTVSYHCDVASTSVLKACTSTYIGGYQQGPSVSSIEQGAVIYTPAAVAIAITSGQEKLDGVSATEAAQHSSSTSGTGSPLMRSSAATTASNTGVASTNGVNIGTVGLLGLAVGFFVR
ncbi:hypothetical protein K461DRAFT_295711 [Myriangium duriaei CBS 260.36]|uniref:Uncharacterized protein n=1 Tax=Myriangium duriaei CBS 260.36 TaxID=1168546 RepID=A0A9P4IUY5_9PEZI|nr:hypothetical protein K461DRAFT_295711 [Myriangium duriaei CBS 260.36]